MNLEGQDEINAFVMKCVEVWLIACKHSKGYGVCSG